MRLRTFGALALPLLAGGLLGWLARGWIGVREGPQPAPVSIGAQYAEEAAWTGLAPTKPGRVGEILARIRRACEAGVWRRSSAWQWLLGPLTSSELEHLVRSLGPLLHHPAQRELRTFLMELWARKDAEAALRHVWEWPGSGERDRLVVLCCREWLEQNPQSAGEWIRALPASPLRHELVNLAVEVWSRTDPAGALEWCRELPATLRGRSYEVVFEAWGATAPQEAFNYLVALNLPPQQGYQAVGGLWRAWARSSPTDALESARRLQSDVLRHAAWRAVFQSWAELAPRDAAAHAVQLPEGLERNRAVMTLIEFWPESDPEGAMNLLEELPGGTAREEALRLWMPHWAQVEPEAAWEEVNRLPRSAVQMELAGQVLRQWALDDPETALQKAQTLPLGQARTELLTDILTHLARQDPQTAWTRAQQWSVEGERSALYAALARAWTDIDPGRAAEVASRLPAGPVQMEVIPEVAMAYAAVDGRAAREWVAGLPEGPARRLALERLAQQWASLDPRAALEWVLTTSVPAEQRRLVDTVLQEWVRQDSAAAIQWWQQIPDPELRSHLAGSVAHELVYSNPLRALEMAEQITDMAERKSLFDRLAHVWGRYDFEGALAQLERLRGSEVVGAFLNGLIRGAAESDPARAWSLWQRFGPGGVPAEALTHIFDAWSMQDPATAARHVWEISDPTIRAQVMEQLTAQWTTQSPDKVLAWLQTLPATPERDLALAVHLRQRAVTDPQVAHAWLNAIQNPSLREQLRMELSGRQTGDAGASVAPGGGSGP